MDIGRAYMDQKVIGKQFEGVGIIRDFRMSTSGLNLCYVEVELEDGNIISTPLDLVIPY